MNLAEMKRAYASGEVRKQQYIDEMYYLHSRLFEYPEFLRDTDIARIEITDEGVVAISRKAGIRLFCDPRDKRLVPIETLNFGQYEKVELGLALRMIRPSSTVLDVGSNVGWYSLNIAKAIPDVRVFAFEPIPHTFDLLLRNIRINEAANIHPNNFGFYDQAGTMVLYFCNDSSGSASAENIGERRDAQEVTCQVNTVDDFIADTGLKVHFIKCDVEGAELRVFRGANKCLADQKPVVLTEMLRKWCRKFSYHPNDIIELFAGFGYRCFVPRKEHLLPFARMDESTEDTNFFFLHAAEHAPLIRELSSVEEVGA